MELNRTTSLRLIKVGSAVIVGLIILGYALSRSFTYTRGPAITIFQPQDNSTISTSIVDIEGRVDRVNSLKLNGQAISIDEQGHFKETITLFPGMNVISIFAEDQFKRSTQTQLHIVGTVDFPVKVNNASSTANSASYMR